jgi:hypothetical protein
MTRKTPDQFDYIRNAYGLNVGKGTRVTVGGKLGTVTGATHHVLVRVDGERHAEPWHPSDVKVML